MKLKLEGWLEAHKSSTGIRRRARGTEDWVLEEKLRRRNALIRDLQEEAGRHRREIEGLRAVVARISRMLREVE